MGVNLKGISSRVVKTKSATGFAVDFGGLYYPPLEWLAIGLAIQNLGTELKFIDEGHRLPLKFVWGSLSEVFWQPKNSAKHRFSFSGS